VVHWPEAYQKITATGKKIHIASNKCECPFDVLDVLSEQLDKADHIVYTLEGDVSDLDRAEEILRKYGVKLQDRQRSDAWRQGDYKTRDTRR
jgi:hypothetical protein